MDLNRLLVESLLVCFLSAFISRLGEFFYRLGIINYLAYTFLKIGFCALLVGFTYYKKGSNTSEFGQISIAGLIGLWIES